MIERSYDGSLEGLFAILEELCQDKPAVPLPKRIRREIPTDCFGISTQEQPGLFDNHRHQKTIIPLYFTPRAKSAVSELYEVSIKAYDACIHGWMSELPIEADILHFAWKLIAAARAAGTSIEARNTVEKLITCHNDPLVNTVFGAAYKVRREIHRLLGFLRFIPDSEGIYIAHCTPDHFTLPAVARHFALRFGNTPWIIIDDKRNLCLSRTTQETEPVLFRVDRQDRDISNHDSVQKLWLQYHTSINNESRNNPMLQRQFMPERYWQYLPEMEEKAKKQR